ncbi:hypothetical protein TUZN_1045 [Thermoproteus uzoniensis 768-20]|uniref:Uncharacterized protein n=1 Tax=Thermoproteus uzoniensis (strain 768-20) TaxID=999630 RepID=F2L6D0_THEU7|nr:hypothetical protein [Thermoproteus uzoniensis]AEA12526.1 hypothetical protein TUZN_1045 [Thermoproteus uzoniensis 768-20]
MDRAGRFTVASAVGYVVAALFNAILDVVKESVKAVNAWLTTTFGHHWIGHGVLVVLSFVIATALAALVYRGTPTDSTIRKITIAVLATTIVSVLIIATFYTTHG